MTPIEQAVMWAIADVEELGHDPMTHLDLTKALAQLYYAFTRPITTL